MRGFENFFIDAATQAPYLAGHHHPGLVLLSVLVSIFSATMALQTAQLAREAETTLLRQIALSTGAIALGGGIWAMHFIGMLSFELPTQVRYSAGLTLLSFLPACAASWLALSLLARNKVTFIRLILSGSLVGLGIGAMHYTGMAAMQTSAQMLYDPVLFTLSIALAAILAIFSLWVGYGMQRLPLNPIARALASGILMGLAIAGMHYTGMQAVHFFGEASAATNGMLLSNSAASLALSAFTIMMTAPVTLFNGLLRSRSQYRQTEEIRLRLNAILDTAVDGIITIDSRGRIMSFNHSAERLFGWKLSEIVGRNINMLMPEPQKSQHDSYLQNYLSSGIPKIIGSGREVVGLRKDGSLMPMRLAVGRVNLPNELLFVGFVTDITARHELEASLREAAERAEQATAAKSTFLANMSHEIRTPMNSIIGFTELLLQRDLGATERTHLNTIRQSSLSLLRLLNDILDTTKMEKGSVTLEAIDFSLKGLAMQIESTLRLSVQAKQLTLTTHYPEDMPEHFCGDPLRVLQVLTNLVNNAIKFTQQGSIDVVFSYENGAIHIQVRDTGIGMTSEQIAAIFSPFIQADASISRRFGGTGLGTTIARQLAELMNGRIEVESAPGRGSIFHVYLPLPIGQQRNETSDSTLPALPTLNVLLADDVPQNRELLSLLLHNHGHQVTPASNGDEAVKKFMAAHYDMVLMDMHMPGTDGLQATQLIRQYERTNGRRHTPIIALTASVMEADKHAARQAGMDGFATKPLEIPQLFEEIARLLELHGLASDASPSTPVGDTASAPPLESSATETELPAIDWPTGTEIWGDPVRLAQAMKLFLQTAPDSLPQPDKTSDIADWEALRFSLHSVRGAAGNLALPAIAKLAGELEDQIQSGRLDGIVEALPKLHDLLQEAGRQLRHSGHLDAPLPPPSNAELLNSMKVLLSYLNHNELHDDTFEQVCDGLSSQGEHDAAQLLRSAVLSFEFTDARTLIQELIAARSAGVQA